MLDLCLFYFFSTNMCLFFLLPDMFVGGKLDTRFAKLMVVTRRSGGPGYGGLSEVLKKKGGMEEVEMD